MSTDGGGARDQSQLPSPWGSWLPADSVLYRWLDNNTAGSVPIAVVRRPPGPVVPPTTVARTWARAEKAGDGSGERTDGPRRRQRLCVR